MRHILAAGLVLCAAPSFALDCEDGFRAFEHATGTTCIPQDPQRIVTLQDQNGLLPLMELGVTPVASMGHQLPNGDRVFRRMDGYDTSDVEWIGSYRGPFEPEIIAATNPDLIIATYQEPENAEQLRQIAPLVVIDMFRNPMDVALFQYADIVGKTELAEELQAEFQARAAETREKLGAALAETTVSFISYRPDENQFYASNPTQAIGMIMEELQPIRPEPERTLTDERLYRSIETIGEHAADVMFLVVFDQDVGGDSDTYGALMEEALVKTLPVSQAGQLVALDGIAMVGSAWAKAINGLEQVSAVLTASDLNRDLVAE
ncbi:MAG: hypothetical protein AAGF30_03485 [Pseudomonadota bacterium]